MWPVCTSTACIPPSPPHTKRINNLRVGSHTIPQLEAATIARQTQSECYIAGAAHVKENRQTGGGSLLSPEPRRSAESVFLTSIPPASSRQGVYWGRQEGPWRQIPANWERPEESKVIGRAVRLTHMLLQRQRHARRERQQVRLSKAGGLAVRARTGERQLGAAPVVAGGAARGTDTRSAN